MHRRPSFVGAALTLMVALGACSGSERARQPPYHARYFKEVRPGRAEQVLAGAPKRGLFTRMVELDEAGRRVSDTLRVWVEHVPRPGLPLAKEALKADLIVSCHPRGIQNPRLRERHVFPEAKGYVYLNYVGEGYLVATDRTLGFFRFVQGVRQRQYRQRR